MTEFPRSQDSRVLAIGIAALAVLLRVQMALATHFTQEDFLITLRYAENIAHGHGFVFNAGERVLGTTTPLYTLMLAGLSWLGLPAAPIGKGINIAADGVLCIVLFRILSLLKQETAGLCAAFLAAVNPIQLRVAVSGQESSLVALCGAAIWMLFLQRRYFAAYVLGGVLFLLRWDGLLLVAVLTVAIVARERKPPVKEFAVFALVCAPWLLFATWYFGSPIPVTLAAKTVVYGWYFRADHLPQLSRLLQRVDGTPLYAMMALAVFAGVARLIRARLTPLIPAAAWFILYWSAFLASRVLLFEWYLVPPLFVYEIFAGLGIAAAAERISRYGPRPLHCALAASCVLTLSFINVRDALSYTRELQGLEDHLRKPLGLWLLANSRPTDRVMLEPIGYIGYYSRLPVVDMTGLVTPSVLPYYDPKNACPWLGVAEANQPEWCVLRPDEAARVLSASEAAGRPWSADYTNVKSFSYTAHVHGPKTVFLVYRRNAKPALQVQPPH